MTVVNLLVWAGILLFFIGALSKIIRFARMPMHLRWELYPVPKEKAKASYGGSFLEEANWWTKEIHESKLTELKAMSEEILLLKGVHEANRPMWYWSWPLHFGLYLLVATIGLLLVGAIVEIVTGTALAAGAPFWLFVHHLTKVVCWAGLILAAVGSLGLLSMRLTSPKLTGFTSPFSILNLLFMFLLFGIGICSRLNGDADAALLRAAVAGILTLKAPAAALSWQMMAELIGFAFFVAYLPVTFMSHMYMKFFTYHMVRWDDHPRRPGEPTDERLLEYLTWNVGWSASHVTKNGKHKTWADVVMDQEVDK
ncbi:MAG: hypothetical protein ABIF77_14300 [bacterium]